MAIEEEDKIVARKRMLRTWRIQIDCPADRAPSAWTCEWLRSSVKRLSTGELDGVEATNGPRIVKTAAELAGKSWTVSSGRTITGADIMEALAMEGDNLHRELMEEEAARLAALAASANEA